MLSPIPRQSHRGTVEYTSRGSDTQTRPLRSRVPITCMTSATRNQSKASVCERTNTRYRKIALKLKKLRLTSEPSQATMASKTGRAKLFKAGWFREACDGCSFGPQMWRSGRYCEGVAGDALAVLQWWCVFSERRERSTVPRKVSSSLAGTGTSS